MHIPGGDSDKFKEINEAYDVLRDPEKRKIYDEVRRRLASEKSTVRNISLLRVFEVCGECCALKRALAGPGMSSAVP